MPAKVRRQKKPLSEEQKKALFVCVLIFSAIYLGWRSIFTLPFGFGAVAVFFGIALVLAEGISVVEALFHYKNMIEAKLPEKPEIPRHMYPDVDVLIATHNEGPEVLYKTLNGCIFLKYPDKGKVHIFLCDDNDRPEMKRLAERMGVGYFGLSGNRDAKAGNLNNALSKTSSPLVLTLDADMIPTSELLLETVPYFFLPKMIKENDKWRLRAGDELDENEKVGFVQTPQSFYNADLFQFNLFVDKSVPNEQDYFFREINIGRNRTNSVVYAGSNTLISREALQAVGGIRTKTITEDFATGLDIQAAGYTSFAIGTALAHGLAPNDFKSLIKQRQRWARGCVQVLCNRRFLFGDLPLQTKGSYIVCFLYWWTFFRRFIYILSPILFSVFGIVVVNCSFREILFIWLPCYFMFNWALQAMSGNIRNTRWSNLVDTILFPYLILPVIAETFGIRMKKFHVTPKVKESSKNSELKYALPHLLLIFPSVAGIIFCFNDIFSGFRYGGFVVLYWLFVNTYMLANAVIFSLGRITFRNDDRQNVIMPVTLRAGDLEIDGNTSDISENGLSVMLANPEYLPYNGSFGVKLAYKDYRAQVAATVIHVGREGEFWKYSLKITSATEENYRQYLQIVFDRQHTLPKAINSTLLEEIIALLGHLRKPRDSIRKLPRIPLNTVLLTESGRQVNLLEFSYEYLVLKNVPGLEDSPVILFGDGISLQCRRAKEKPGGAGGLYHIENWEEISGDRSFREKLFAMIETKSQIEDAAAR